MVPLGLSEESNVDVSGPQCHQLRAVSSRHAFDSKPPLPVDKAVSQLRKLRRRDRGALVGLNLRVSRRATVIFLVYGSFRRPRYYDGCEIRATRMIRGMLRRGKTEK